MFLKIINYLKSRPKHVRDQYSFVMAVALTLMIGGVWTLSLPSRLNGALPGTLAVATTSLPQAPLANFFTQFKNQFASVKEAVNNVPNRNDATVQESSQANNSDPLKMRLTSDNKHTLSASSSNYVYTNPSASPSSNQISERQTILIGTSTATATNATTAH